MSPFQQITITKHKIPNILMIDESSFFFPYLKKKTNYRPSELQTEKKPTLKSKVLQQEHVIQRVILSIKEN